MFNWLKRRASAPSRSSKGPARGSAPVRKPVAPPNSGFGHSSGFGPSTGFGAMPLPEVVAEGATEADWSQWEDSMLSLDSQLQGLVPSNRVYVKDGRGDTRPSQLGDDEDPFATVRSKRR